jgi:ParB-like nuclease domain
MIANGKVFSVRDRIKELRRVPASELVANEKNFRKHPLAQRQALRGLLKEVGMADALLARELPDGRLKIVDGHLRKDELKTAIVPVLILDVSEEEADKLLASLDPLAAMAETDDRKREVDILGKVIAGPEAEAY